MKVVHETLILFMVSIVLTGCQLKDQYAHNVYNKIKKTDAEKKYQVAEKTVSINQYEYEFISLAKKDLYRNDYNSQYTGKLSHFLGA